MGRNARIKLRKAREELLLSQKDAGDLIGVHPLTVARWETGISGKNKLSRSTTRRYCQALAEYAASLGRNSLEYRTHLLCPGEFPDPALVIAKENW